MYTAVPQVAMRAPTSHMINATPTLPDDRRMLLGVAYILVRFVFISNLIDLLYNAPCSYHPIKNKKSSAEEAYKGCGLCIEYDSIK